MARILSIFALFLSLLMAIQSASAQQGASTIANLLPPTSGQGSVNLTYGDIVPATRGGVPGAGGGTTFGLLAGWGGTCGSNQWVNYINGQGVPTCAQPLFSNIGGTVSSSQFGTVGVANGGTGLTSLGSASQCLQVNSGGTALVYGSCIPGTTITGSGTASYVTRWTGSETVGIGVLYDNGVNVGIGTSSPFNTLEVGGGLLGTFSGSHISVSNAVANSGIDLGQASGYHGHINWAYNATPANAYMSMGVANGTNPLSLQDSGGSVGIGTTSPLSLLSVAGNLALGAYGGGTSSHAAPNNGLIVSGNVSIGTSVNAYPLQVVGTVSATSYYVGGSQIAIGNLATIGSNTVAANVTSSAASPASVSLPTCADSGGNHLNYTLGTGFSCGSTSASGSPFTTQNVVTGSRAVNSVYQNTTGKTLFVVITVTTSANQIMSVLSDSNSSPSTNVGNTYSASNYATFSFMVLNNNYYQLTGQNTGAMTIGSWTEWH